ncbi:hypothetical protein JCM8547_004359 [Rhodosporidiobolus lusitaniae]
MEYRDRSDRVGHLFSSSSLSSASPLLSPFLLRPLVLLPFSHNAGQPVKVRLNAFEVKAPEKTIFHYDVKIGPANAKRRARLNRSIWAALVGSPKNPFSGLAVAYDGRAMAYAPRRLPCDSGHFTVPLPDSSESFTVTITFIRPIQLGALSRFVGVGRGAEQVPEAAVMSAIQGLNIFIQHGPMQIHPSRGPSFFLRGQPPANVGMGLEMWRSYFTSLRPGINKTFVNLDLTSQPVFAPGNMGDVLLELARLDVQRLTPRDLNSIPPHVAVKLSRMIKGLRITRTVPGQNNTLPKRKISPSPAAPAPPSF